MISEREVNHRLRLRRQSQDQAVDGDISQGGQNAGSSLLLYIWSLLQQESALQFAHDLDYLRWVRDYKGA
jgi:hypothetical protein